MSSDPGRARRVLHVVTRMNVGGPARHLQTLLPRLRARGVEPVLMHGVADEGEGELPLEDDGVAVVRNPWLRRRIDPVADLRASNEIRRAISWIRPDVVHTHMAKAGLLGRQAADATGVTSVHTFHGHVLEGYFATPANRVFLTLERRLARRTGALVAVSHAVRDDLAALGIGEPSRWHVVPLGFDLAAFGSDEPRRWAARRALGIGDDTLAVGIVGRLVPIKNHPLFLEAARLVADRAPRARFIVAGDGELRVALEAEARAALADRVAFTGWVHDLPSLYAALDLVVLTSLNEGTPVALMEAGAAGVAVVATDVGGVRDVVDDGTTGRLVPSGDADGVAAAILELLDDDAARGRLGAEAARQAPARFSPEAMTARLAHLYRSIAGPPDDRHQLVP
jgi:glycosyltransferase involved in cell wall biosynthesis